MSEIFRKIQEATQDVADRARDVAEMLGVSAGEQPPEAQRAAEEPIVSFRDVELAFDRPILRGVSFDLHAGATKIVLGGSGSGKTTILRLMLGLLKPDAGSIRVDGTDIASLDEDGLRRVRLKIGMVFQEGALFDSMSVADNVGYRLVEDAVAEDVVAARVAEILGFVGLGAHADKGPAELSGGQRRRVAFARALAPGPAIMLYDEPTTGLDPITATTITDLIVKVRDLDGATSILVTHQLRDAFNVARSFVRKQGDEFLFERIEDFSKLAGTEFLMLREGSVVFEGSPHELVSSRDPYIREFLS